MDRQIDLNSLMLFYEVIEAGSLTGASAKLKLAKSTVSRRLARMEQHFGSILVKKGARKLMLTEVGASLHKHCQTIAAELNQASREALTAHSAMQGTLRLSVPGDLGMNWIGGMISDFARCFPELTIATRVHANDVNDATREPFDIAIQIGEGKPSQLICKRLATLSRGVYAAPEYLQRCGTPETLADCREHDWIVTDVQEREGVLLFRGHSKGRSIRVERKFVTSSARLARELAIAGLGLALLPDVLCADAVKAGHLVRIMVPWQSPPFQITALFLSRDRIPRKARAFLEFFAERVKSVVRP